MKRGVDTKKLMTSLLSEEEMTALRKAYEDSPPNPASAAEAKKTAEIAQTAYQAFKEEGAMDNAPRLHV
ncbi:MAG: hypothetical protein SFW66_02150 [Gammaproteobacteria bacterium]|nr:hypothetical protein [Gammaproteobacteria bacterium]